MKIHKLPRIAPLLFSLIMVSLIMTTTQISVAKESERVEQAAQPGMSSQMSATQARAELQRLVDESIFVASQQLNDIGTFYPYAAVMESNGEIRLVGVPAAGDKQRPEPKQTLKALKKALIKLAQKKQYRAVALFVDFVALRNDTGGRQPGIRIELEHRLPDHLLVFMPYLISKAGVVSLMTPQYMPGTLSVLRASSE